MDAWMRMRVTSGEQDFKTASRPFCKTRRGFVYSEGAVCLILKLDENTPDFTLESMVHQSAAENQYAQSEQSMSHCMATVLIRAEKTIEDIAFIHASANGSIIGDRNEALAIARIFGEQTLPVYSSKALYGNVNGASGLVNMLHSLLILKNKYLPQNPHIIEKDEEIASKINCAYTANGLDGRNQRNALINAFGIGGINCSMIISTPTHEVSK
jgi:3-oxoacyl-[acyl-carrier-protein] synthase II